MMATEFSPRNRIAAALLGLCVIGFFTGTGMGWWPLELDIWMLFWADVIAFWAVPICFLWLYLAANGVALGVYSASLFSKPDRYYFETSLAIGFAVAAFILLVASIVAWKTRHKA